jgi:serine/arginine repetitive matrix protein 2
MATKTQSTPSASSRMRFAFGPKRLPPDPPENENDADWYIPYNGPYELPSSAPPPQTRDSWGQLLGSVLSNLESVKPSGGLHEWSDGRITSTLPSSGTYSSHPYRMTVASDSAGAPGTTTTASQGRSAISQSIRGGRPRLNTVSSTPFANIDATGGVGESPTPVQRSSFHPSPTSASSRMSLASLLTFAGSTRKSRSDSASIPRHTSGKRSRNGTPTHDPLQSNHATIQDAQLSRSRSPVRLDPPPMRRPRQRSNTLIGNIITTARTSSHDISPTSFPGSDGPSSRHPYAYPFPSAWTDTPPPAPAILPTVSRSLDKGKGVDRSYLYPRPPPPDTLNKTEVPAHLKPASRTSLLKTISAPNLRNFSRGFAISKPTTPRGKYRWLSPETWCDALLFPRPRFMAHIDDEESSQPFSYRHDPGTRPSEARTGSERITLPQTQLRASRSAVNLALNSETSPGPPRAEPMLMAQIGQSSLRRARSFAQDDLALPSPVPSLARWVTSDIPHHMLAYQLTLILGSWK